MILNKIAVFSPDAVPVKGALAAGPGIRYFEIARAMDRAGLDVTLFVPSESFERSSSDIKIEPWSLNGLGEAIRDKDAVILPQVHGGLSRAYPKTADISQPTAVDLYDPVLIENLGLQDESDNSVLDYDGYLRSVVPILKRGDYFFCANERQRYYYLGVLNVLGRINPLTFHEDILGMVPYGVSSEPAVHSSNVMRGKIVGTDDKVILWFSGIYPWFDAVTLIEALPIILKEIQNAKLVILGGVHPRSHAPDDEFKKTVKRAQELGLIDSSVFLVDWQPYEERANWYLESDLAVTTHKKSLETDLSHRTRVVDFIWAGLPVIVSKGDEFGRIIESAGCGYSVPIKDRQALAAKVIEVLSNEDLRETMKDSAKKLAAELRWDKVVQPLIDWAKDPKIAKDRSNKTARESVLKAVDTIDGHEMVSLGKGEERNLADKVRVSLKSDGLIPTIKRSLGAGRRKIKGEGG